MIEETIETRNEELKREILRRYVKLSWEIADLSAAMSTESHIGIVAINYGIKQQMVHLSTLAMINEKFAEEAGPICDRYRMGKRMTKLRAQKQSWARSRVSSVPNYMRSAKDTMLMWKFVSKKLVETKLINLSEV